MTPFVYTVLSDTASLTWVLPLLLWVARTVKVILFWLYLWQVKEYHIGRFLDHFRTQKGKVLVWNRLIILKTFLFFIFCFFLFGFFDPSQRIFMYLPELAGSRIISFTIGSAGGLFVVYFLEVLKAIKDVQEKRLRYPVLTTKTLVLIAASALLISVLVTGLYRVSQYIVVATNDKLGITFLSFFPAGLLAIDLLMPVLVSAVVLGLQPLAVLGRKRIIAAAKKKRGGMKKLSVIGITGSYGKTTTKEFLAHILGQRFRVLKTPEHANSEVGISNVILRSLTDEHDVFVCEMGAYNKGGIKLLADIAKPHIGIVTGVNEQHLATFGSMENLLSAEGGEELVEALPKVGTMIINQKSIRQLAVKNQSANWRTKCKIVYPQIPNSVQVYKDHITFTLEDVRLRLNVLGAYNVENFVLAAAAAKQLGMTLQEIAKATETIKQEFGAMRYKKGVGGLNIIDSTYSANPDGVIAALEYLKVWKGRKVIVMPCLIELGKASKEVHQRIGEKIAKVCDLAILTTRECMPFMGDVLFMENPNAIFEKIKEFNGPEDVVLLESRVPQELLRLVYDTAH